MNNIDQFTIYSNVNMSNLKHDEDEKILEELKKLCKFKNSKDVLEFLDKNFHIKDFIENFYISPHVKISVGQGKKYFNITYEYTRDEEIKIESYNYNLNERSIA